MNPYDILNVDAQATDEAIKKAYLQKVREFPPEHAAEAFQQVRQAYERIKTQKDRMNDALFGTEAPDVGAALLHTLGEVSLRRVDADTFAKALAAGALHPLQRTKHG